MVHKQTGQMFVDTTAIPKQMIEVSDSQSLRLLQVNTDRETRHKRQPTVLPELHNYKPYQLHE